MHQRVSDLHGMVGQMHERELGRDKRRLEDFVEEIQHVLLLARVSHSLDEQHVQEHFGMELRDTLIGQHQIAPTEHIAKIELERIDVLCTTHVLNLVQSNHKRHHFLEHAPHGFACQQRIVASVVLLDLLHHQLLADQKHVVLLQRIDVHARKSVDKRARKSLATSAFFQRILHHQHPLHNTHLTREDLERWRALELFIDLGNVNRSSMIQA